MTASKIFPHVSKKGRQDEPVGNFEKIGFLHKSLPSSGNALDFPFSVHSEAGGSTPIISDDHRSDMKKYKVLHVFRF